MECAIAFETDSVRPDVRPRAFRGRLQAALWCIDGNCIRKHAEPRDAQAVARNDDRLLRTLSGHPARPGLEPCGVELEVWRREAGVRVLENQGV